MVVVTTEGKPSVADKRNFEMVMSRWGELWPQFRRLIGELMASYEREAPDWSNVNCVYLTIPSVPIAEGAEWGIGVVFRSEQTMWTLPYEGWTVCPDQAQASY